ncbi:hypothetical protein [Natronosalvus caseinilyticus]|nr:hypothetical protein [Natronosalvus caseinilyticus]
MAAFGLEHGHVHASGLEHGIESDVGNRTVQDGTDVDDRHH